VSFLKALLFSIALAVNLPKPVGLVNDFASLFSENFRSRLELQLSDLKTKTTVEFAVVTVKNLENLTVEEYSNQLFKAWGIGQKDKDNGLLLLISKDDKKIRFETGYGLEGTLPDGRLGEIIRTKISPEFKKGDYEAGVLSAVNTISQYLIDPSSAPPISESDSSFLALSSFVLIFIVYLLSYISRSKEFFTGGVVGLILGLIIGRWYLALGFGFFGLILDYFLSKNYKNLVANGKSTGFWSSRGGFGGGGGGFGGFGGGRSGGGGASGGW